jgi:TatD DNase family protein
MTVLEKQRRLVAEFSAIENRRERLAAVMERARGAAPEGLRTEGNRVALCQTPVWVAGDFSGGRLTLRSDADSALVRGLVGLLCELYDGGTAAEALSVEPTLFDELGIAPELSPTRRTGLAGVRRRVVALAEGELRRAGAGLFDAHCHLSEAHLQEDWGSVEAACRGEGILRAVSNSDGEHEWEAVGRLAEKARWVIPAFGVHPWVAGNRGADWLGGLRRRLVANPRAGIGEIGLDRWMLERAAPDDARLAGLRRAGMEEQAEVFSEQWKLAVELGRVATVHCIRAFGDLEKILRGLPAPGRGFLLHGYSGPAELTDFFAGRGAWFSFNAGCLREVGREALRRLVADGGELPRRLEVWRRVPLERLLVETDAPAMRPPEEWARFSMEGDWRGARLNHPADLGAGYEALALLRGMTAEALAARVAENFRALFGE